MNELLLTSDIWFKEGYPKYWDAASIREIGLSNDNIINSTKMAMMQSMGYSKVVSLLNLGPYNAEYSVYDASNNTIFHFPDSGIVCNMNAYSIERIGVLGDSSVRIRTVLCD